MKATRYFSIIGVIILFFLVKSIGLGNILESFKTINYMVSFAFGILFCIIVTQTWKWYSILHIQGIEVRYWALFKINIIGIFYGTLTPGRAGSFLKALYLKKELNKPAMELTSSVMLERLLDFLLVGALALVGAFLFVGGNANLLITLIAILLIFIFGLIVIMKKENFLFFYKLFEPLIPRKLHDNLEVYINNFYKRMLKKRQLLYPAFITVINWIVTYSGSYVIALALDIHVNFFVFMSLFSLATMISLIPITVGGVGTRELALVTLFAPFGIAKESMFTISILSLVIFLIIPSIIGWIITLVEK